MNGACTRCALTSSSAAPEIRQPGVIFGAMTN